MNDPGFDEPIQEEARIVENQREEDEMDEAEEDEQSFLQPSRWWFASTAFPLTAGTFGPMASAFSICALAVHWRETIPPGGSEGSGDSVDDPAWLVGINAAQVAIALISNLFLLLNMARRVRFAIAQPITIIGWYISSLTLTGLTATAAGPLRLDASINWAYTQAFYYAIISAGLYFICASLMVVTALGAHAGRYEKEFNLTTSQRTLMLQTISFLVYLLLGALIYSHVEGWAYLDAVYYTDFTLLTIGIGDIAPVTGFGRGFLFPFAIGGIIILGLVVGSIRSLVLERGKVKLGARMVEKERRRIIKEIDQKCRDLLVPIDDGKTKNLDENLDKEMKKSTERQRREREFHIMRKVQERAATRRRWMSLVVSALTWFALWFAGAAVFQATEVNQQWDYFAGLYFAYTSLLTIGYGDISPISNAGRPFFVFWSLLAVPSLTILISNMGDTIVKAIKDATLRIGEFTLLPSQQGFRQTFKETVNSAAARMFSVKETPPGVLGDLNNRSAAGDKDGGSGNRHARKNDPEGAGQRAAGAQADIEAKRAREDAKTSDKRAMPRSRRHYHSMLIQEISSVMRHLNSSPPRKYTFDEWAWYLKLVGEDESSPETHRKAIRKPDLDDQNLGTMTGRKMDEDEQIKWSWVGNRSPLMGNKEEAEWVLERLTKTLARELEAMRREEAEERGDWAEGGKMAGFGKARRMAEDEGMREDKDGAGNDESNPSHESSRTVTFEEHET